MNNPDDPKHWMTKAENDLLNIENNLQSARVPWDTVCFHAQQAAEKSLKGFLVSRRQILDRTHDLAVLLAQCAMIDGSFSMLEADCRFPNPYSVLARYPDAFGDPAEAEGRAAAAAASRIYHHCRNILP